MAVGGRDCRASEQALRIRIAPAVVVAITAVAVAVLISISRLRRRALGGRNGNQDGASFTTFRRVRSVLIMTPRAD